MVEKDGIVAVNYKQIGTSKNVIMAHLKTKCRLSSKKICESNVKTCATVAGMPADNKIWIQVLSVATTQFREAK
jgi:hypothetical protein